MKNEIDFFDFASKNMKRAFLELAESGHIPCAVEKVRGLETRNRRPSRVDRKMRWFQKSFPKKSGSENEKGYPVKLVRSGGAIQDAKLLYFSKGKGYCRCENGKVVSKRAKFVWVDVAKLTMRYVALNFSDNIIAERAASLGNMASAENEEIMAEKEVCVPEDAPEEISRQRDQKTKPNTLRQRPALECKPTVMPVIAAKVPAIDVSVEQISSPPPPRPEKEDILIQDILDSIVFTIAHDDQGGLWMMRKTPRGKKSAVAKATSADRRTSPSMSALERQLMSQEDRRLTQIDSLTSLLGAEHSQSSASQTTDKSKDAYFAKLEYQLRAMERLMMVANDIDAAAAAAATPRQEDPNKARRRFRAPLPANLRPLPGNVIRLQRNQEAYNMQNDQKDDMAWCPYGDGTEMSPRFYADSLKFGNTAKKKNLLLPYKKYTKRPYAFLPPSEKDWTGKLLSNLSYDTCVSERFRRHEVSDVALGADENATVKGAHGNDDANFPQKPSSGAENDAFPAPADIQSEQEPEVSQGLQAKNEDPNSKVADRPQTQESAHGDDNRNSDPQNAQADATFENVLGKIGDWEVCTDEYGNVFYYNPETNESSWEKPTTRLGSDSEESGDETEYDSS